MATTRYFRLKLEVPNPFHDRRSAYSVQSLECFPEAGLLQFNYFPEKVEVNGKIKEYEQLHSVRYIDCDFNSYSIERFVYKKDRLDFWSVLSANSEPTTPRNNSEIHVACDNPATNFYIELLRKNGYTFEQLKSLHDEYAKTHYE